MLLTLKFVTKKNSEQSRTKCTLMPRIFFVPASAFKITTLLLYIPLYFVFLNFVNLNLMS